MPVPTNASFFKFFFNEAQSIVFYFKLSAAWPSGSERRFYDGKGR